jgi:hypothetical protein
MLKNILNEIKSSFVIELDYDYETDVIQDAIDGLAEYEIFTISKGKDWYSFSFESIQVSSDNLKFSNPYIIDDNEKEIAKNISEINRKFGITLKEIQKFVRSTIYEDGTDISFVQKEFKLAKLG